MIKIRATAFVILATLVLVASDAQSSGGNQNPGVIPPHATYRGHTYPEWEAKFLQAVFALPVVNGEHPFISGGVFGGDDGVMFLTGTTDDAPVEITIPAGTPLFASVVSAECSQIEPDPFHGDNEAELRECANHLIDNTSGLFALIDGGALDNLDAYRIESALFEFGPLPQDNLFAFFGLDVPAGTTSLSVDAGVYLLLAPLSVGEHILHFGFEFFGFSFDTTYIITVTPKIVN